MKKNILAENMRRIGTKNLSEQNLDDLENKLGFDSGADRDPRNGNLMNTDSTENSNNVNSFIDALRQYNKISKFNTYDLFNVEKRRSKLNDREDGYTYKLSNFIYMHTDLNDNFVRASYDTPNHRRPEMFNDFNEFKKFIVDGYKVVAPDLAKYVK